MALDEKLTRSSAFKQHDIAYERMIFKKFFALYADLGTAKTFMLLKEFMSMWQAGIVDGILVIAPVGVHEQWITEELPATTSQRCVAAMWPDQPPPIMKTTLPRIYTIYPEAFRRKPVPPKRLPDESLGDFRKRRKEWRTTHHDLIDMLKEYLLSGRIGLLVDEAQMLMNKKAKTTRRVKELKPLAAYRRVASGYPAPKGLIDYFSQYSFLSTKILGLKTKKEFEERYCEMGGFRGKQIIGYKNEKDFYRRVGPYTYTVTLDECVDMPERTWLKFPVDLSPEQRRLITQIKTEFKAELDGKKLFMPMVLQRLTRVQQIACGFLPFEEDEDAEGPRRIKLRWVPEFRTKALENVLDQMRGKVIIWSRFTPCIDRLTKHFGDQAVMYRGGMDRAERADNKLRFQRDSRVRLIFAQPKSAGAGFNGLQVSRYSIYWNNSHDSQLRVQTERRIWRLGQSRACVYGDLLARGTFDAQIRRVVMGRQSVSQLNMASIAGWLAT